MSRDTATAVLVVAHSAARGGAEYCLDNFLRSLDRSRLVPLVIFPREGPMADSARDQGHEVLIVPLCQWLYFTRDGWYWRNLARRLVPNVLRLAWLIRRRRLRLVYTNTSAVFESALAARLAVVPHVWHVHEVLRNGNAMNQALPLPWIKRLIRRLSDRVVFVSDSARRVFSEGEPFPDSVVIPNSLRMVAVADNGGRLVARRRFGLDPDDSVVVFVGQLIDRKNPLLLVAALARLRHVTRLRCLMAGDGPLLEPLRVAIQEAGLVDRCQLIGFQDDVGPVLAAADVLVLPSREESFGLVLLEANSQGMPVIACQAEGPAEIIRPGETGLIVAQDDPEAMAQAIASLFDGTIDRAAMGAAGARHVAANFNADRNARHLESVWFDAVAGHRGDP